MHTFSNTKDAIFKQANWTVPAQSSCYLAGKYWQKHFMCASENRAKTKFGTKRWWLDIYQIIEKLNQHFIFCCKIIHMRDKIFVLLIQFFCFCIERFYYCSFFKTLVYSLAWTYCIWHETFAAQSKFDIMCDDAPRQTFASFMFGIWNEAGNHLIFFFALFTF